MWQTLEALRRQPRAKREQVALLGALMFTGIIALVWVSTLPERLAETAAVMSGDETPESESVLSGFIEGIRERFVVAEEAVEDVLVESDTAAQPAAVGTAVATTSSAVVIPELTPETIAEVTPARVIQLGTSTAPTP